MIALSKLLCDASFAHDPLRYGKNARNGVQNAHQTAKTAAERRPVVVWNITRTCNLKCIHCYSDSDAKKYPGELSVEEAHTMLDDLAAFGIPALLISGGEPLTHPHFWEHLEYARSIGLRCVLSTNATLITPDVAARLKDAGITYVGASLDGIGAVNNVFRGKPWAYERAVEGIRNCKAAGLPISLRMTMTRHNMEDLDGIFEFVRQEEIERVCFYHLAYSGRGLNIQADDMDSVDSRWAVEKIMTKTQELFDRGQTVDVLTVANHCDGPFLYMKLREQDPERAEQVREMLEWNGGGAHSSGVGIADIDFTGNVHADQFWMDYSFGNVKDRPFSEIWLDESDELMAGLKNRLPLLNGRCPDCQFLEMCGGSQRVRAWAAHGDPWADDPSCYLTDEEIGLPVVA